MGPQMSIFPWISFCDDPPEIDISRSGKPPRPRPCPPQWPRASPPGAAAAAPAAPAARQMTRRRANKARLAAARQAGRVSSGRAPFATCVPSKWMGCSTRISGAMAICGTRHGRSTKAQSRTRSSAHCTELDKNLRKEIRGSPSFSLSGNIRGNMPILVRK